jgi:hypothetical protein
VLIIVFAYYYHRHNVGESYPGNYRFIRSSRQTFQQCRLLHGRLNA